MSEAVMFGLALNEAIVRAASAHTLLVASDFDGTLAPLVNDPALAEANPSAIAALNVLAGLRRTHVAVISGRGLASLKDRLGTVHSAHLVGSHGGEFEGQPAISVIQTKLLRRMEAALEAIAGEIPGSRVETKPQSVAFHYRQVEEPMEESEVFRKLAPLERTPNVFSRRGKKVVEFAVVESDKGRALDRLRQCVGASIVIYMGDDETDEDAFAALHDSDAGIKIGEESTRAQFRLPTIEEVAPLLDELARMRATAFAHEENHDHPHHSGESMDGFLPPDDARSHRLAGDDPGAGPRIWTAEYRDGFAFRGHQF